MTENLEFFSEMVLLIFVILYLCIFEALPLFIHVKIHAVTRQVSFHPLFFINAICYGRSLWAAASETKIGPRHSTCRYRIAGSGRQPIPGEFPGKCHLCLYLVTLMLMTSELLSHSRLLLLITQRYLNVTELKIWNMLTPKEFFWNGNWSGSHFRLQKVTNKKKFVPSTLKDLWRFLSSDMCILLF